MSKLYINCFVFRLLLTYLLFVSQTSQSPISLPVWCYPPQIFIGRKEAHDPTRNYITDIGENAPGFVHLLAYGKQPSTMNWHRSNEIPWIVCVFITICGESLFWKVKSSSCPDGPLHRTSGRIFSGGITWPEMGDQVKIQIKLTHSILNMKMYVCINYKKYLFRELAIWNLHESTLNIHSVTCIKLFICDSCMSSVWL